LLIEAINTQTQIETPTEEKMIDETELMMWRQQIKIDHVVPMIGRSSERLLQRIMTYIIIVIIIIRNIAIDCVFAIVSEHALQWKIIDDEWCVLYLFKK
jgi:hypothetical protein